MRSKPVVLRKQARRDVEEAVRYYRREASAAVAARFVVAFEATSGSIAAHPSAGSQRYAHELNLPGLRTRLLRRFPYIVFYVERDDHIDLWRVLHGKQDIPAWLQQPNDT
jgi:toxin ParE1/3/4